ncbi:unnamed protein product [Anisakis simplex]|uniref:Uncharacterized protein n=1 Tax=Anisakis simplex TaxID=6269 RepID=A0A0M3KI02_ANISI|nr:unnamed protein product [Anisakis simplex]
MPKPSSTPHFAENKSNVNNLKAAFDAPYSEQKTSSAPNLDTTSANPGSGVSSSIAERVELLSQVIRQWNY